MFYGTARLFQSVGPAARLSSLSMRLFDAFCILEANRALLFGVDTFLSQDGWLLRQPGLAGQQNTMSSPMETMLILMIQISSFTKQ